MVELWHCPQGSRLGWLHTEPASIEFGAVSAELQPSYYQGSLGAPDHSYEATDMYAHEPLRGVPTSSQ
ncbi:hypothetical protein HaLaN_27401, partial [Haematococcus lacustris]